MCNKYLCRLFVFILLAGCSNDQSLPGGTTDIKDVRKTEEPTYDLEHHKYHDVEVYRVKHSVQIDSVNMATIAAYGISFYRKEDDTLKCYRAYNDAAEDFDKADYVWQNDTLLSIRLYNQETKKEISMVLSGNENRTSIIE